MLKLRLQQGRATTVVLIPPPRAYGARWSRCRECPAPRPPGGPGEAAASNQWKLWADLPEPAKLALRGYYRQLIATYKPTGHLGKAAARLAAELVYTTVGASDLATRTLAARQLGKGRRPKASRVNSAIKRQAFQFSSVNGTLPGGLMGLLAGQAAGRNSRAATPGADLLEALRRAPVLTPPPNGDEA